MRSTWMERKKDLYFRRNVYAVGGAEFFWGLGFPIVMESTFLQIFLKKLGASSFLIGLVPSIFILGVSCFPLFASYLTRNTRFKKKVVFYVHFIPSLAIFLFGLALLVVNDAMVLPLFFFSYVIFSISLGFGIPVWLNYIARIFSEDKTVPGLGYMMLAQNIGKISFSIIIIQVVERYALSIRSVASLFILTGIFFLLGSLCYVFTTELADKNDPKHDYTSFWQHIRTSIGEILVNRPFLTFLIADLDFYVIITVLAFYANYATGIFGVSQATAAGVFVACIYSGSVTVNILLGTMNYLSLKGKFILSKCVTFSCLILLITVPYWWSFFLISYMLGVVRAIRNMVYTPAVKRFSGKTDATSYYSFAPLLTLPVGLGLPMLFGKALDQLEPHGRAGYQFLYGFLAIFILITFYFTLKTKFTRDHKNH